LRTTAIRPKDNNMLLLEIIIIVAAIVFLLVQADKVRSKRRSNAVPELAGKTPAADLPHKSRGTASTTLPLPLQLKIAGTTRLTSSKVSFFGQFGIPVKRICDACVYSGAGTIDAFPEEVAVAIRKLYEEGTAVGPDIMNIIFHERPLAAGEALYFALTRSGTAEHPEYLMYAFLDKVRT